MALQFVDYKTVMKSRNRHASWYEAADRLKPDVWPWVKASFRLAEGATIFTIGSCFARNVEHQLSRRGFRVPTLAFDVKDAPDHPLNKYTPPSIAQEIAWAADLFRRNTVPTESDCQKFAYLTSDNMIIDNNLADFTPVTYEQFISRRRAVYDVFKEAFTADCVIITPGLAEAWYDSERDLFIQQLVTGHRSEITKNLKFAMLDFQTCFTHLDMAVRDIVSLNPNGKIIITTSPIPIAYSFTNEDVIVANNYAKSTLRSACGELAAKWTEVDYFPSYESVTMTRRWDIISSDLLHIEGKFIIEIVNRLVETYCNGVGEAERLFQRSIEEPDPGIALDYIRQAMAIAPDKVDYHLSLGHLYTRLDRLSEAEEEFAKAVTLAKSGSPHAHSTLRPAAYLLFLKGIYEARGDLEKVRDLLLKSVVVEPDSANLHLQLGTIMRRLGDFAGSEQPLTRALELSHADPSGPALTLGDTLRRLGHPQRAIDVWLSVLPKWTGGPGIWRELGVAYVQIGNDGEAERMFTKTLEIDPEHQGVRIQLEHIHARRRRSELR